MESMSLKSMNVQALDIRDACEIDGGEWWAPIPSIVKKLTPAAVAYWVIENWEDVKLGITDGWNVR